MIRTFSVFSLIGFDVSYLISLALLAQTRPGACWWRQRWPWGWRC
jgi:hypothetical protein